MKNIIKIMKFGGAALTSQTAFENLFQIIKNSENDKLICVVSAFGKSTFQIKEASKYALKNELNTSNQIVNELFDFYYNILESFKIKTSKIINCKIELLNLLKGISITNELTDKTLDTLLAYGELSAAIIIGEIAEKYSLNFKVIDPGDIIITNEHYGHAEPDFSLSNKLISKTINNEFKKYDIIIIPGFIAKSKSKNRTTMGFESSNLTAVILAQSLNINEITFWTDVKGIHNADPKKFNNTITVEKISYEQAQILSDKGLKLLYYHMVTLAKARNIYLNYKSLLDINSETTIVNNIKAHNAFLVYKKGYTKINIDDLKDNQKEIINVIKSDQSLFYYNREGKYCLTSVVFPIEELKNKLINYLIMQKFEKLEVDNYSINVLHKVDDELEYKIFNLMKE